MDQELNKILSIDCTVFDVLFVLAKSKKLKEINLNYEWFGRDIYISCYKPIIIEEAYKEKFIDFVYHLETYLNDICIIDIQSSDIHNFYPVIKDYKTKNKELLLKHKITGGRRKSRTIRKSEHRQFIPDFFNKKIEPSGLNEYESYQFSPNVIYK